MGGFGSGRRPSYLARKDTVESCPEVRVASLKNKIHAGLEQVTLNLCRREFVVKLTWQQCNYGGSRPWILCPKCGKKVGVLYLKLSKLACRSCQRLTYAMSQTSKIDRPLLQNRRRCKKKLGGTPEIIAGMTFAPERPRYMHFKTYQRECDRLSYQDSKRCQIFYRQALKKFPQLFEGGFVFEGGLETLDFLKFL